MGSREVNKEQSELHIAALDDEDTKKSITSLRDVFLSSYGPNGHIKVMHNNSGGNITLTSSSTRILQMLSLKNPLLKIVATAVQGHVANHNDAGLFTASFCLLLVENSLTLDLHQKLLTDIYEHLLLESLRCLEMTGFPAKMKLDYSDRTLPLRFIKSIIGPKSASCSINQNSCDYLVNIIFKAFLKAFTGSETSNKLSTIHFLAVEGKPVTDSEIINGVLFEVPHIPTYKSESFNLKTCKDNPHEGQIRVALVCTSMSGDSDEFIDAFYEVSNSSAIVNVTLHHIEQFINHLVKLQVGLIVCQKVVHPKFKALVKKAGVHLIDRLGIKYIEAIHELSGGELIGTFDCSVDASSFGWLNNVEHVILHGKSYLNLQGTSGIITLVLCNRSEQTAEELKNVVNSCIDNLQSTLSQNMLLCGGGCWIAVLISELNNQILQKEEDLCREFHCTKQQLRTAVKSFKSSFQKVMINLGYPNGEHFTDRMYNHFWSFPSGSEVSEDWTCMCGAIKNEQNTLKFDLLCEGSVKQTCEHVFTDLISVQIWDSFPAVINAMQTAVHTANLILGINNFIQNTN